MSVNVYLIPMLSGNSAGQFFVAMTWFGFTHNLAASSSDRSNRTRYRSEVVGTRLVSGSRLQIACGFGGADAQGFYGELTPTGSRQRLSISSQAQLPTLLEAISEPAPYNNLGIPGAKLEEIVSTKLSQANPFFSFVLRNTGVATDSSELDQAIFKQPSLLTLWAGNNDVLGAATSGTSETVTPVNEFKTSYRRYVTLHKKINSEKAPAAVGSYSQGILAKGFVFSSGQLTER